MPLDDNPPRGKAAAAIRAAFEPGSPYLAARAERHRRVLADPRVSYALLARRVLRTGYTFTPKERSFLQQMSAIGFAPTPKQIAWLRKLADRAGCLGGQR